MSDRPSLISVALARAAARGGTVTPPPPELADEVYAVRGSAAEGEVLTYIDGRPEWKPAPAGGYPYLKTLGPGIQPVASNLVATDATSGSGTSAALQTFTMRHPIRLLDEVLAIGFELANWLVTVSGVNVFEQDTGNPIAVSLGVEHNLAAAAVRVLNARQVGNGESIRTHLLGVRCDPSRGEKLYARLMLDVAATNQKFPYARAEQGAQGVYYSATQKTAKGAAIDQTAGTGNLDLTGGTDSTTFNPATGLVPALTYGVLTRPRDKIIASLNDSIGYGYYSPSANFYGDGFLRLAAEGQGYPIIRLGRGSERLLDHFYAPNPPVAVSPTRTARRRAWLPGCTHCFVQLGVNDINASHIALADLKNADRQVCEELQSLGIKVIRCTLTPGAGWAQADADTRAAFNDWILAGQDHHDAVWDIAAAVETGHNTNAWIAGLSQDVLHPNAAGHAAILATFTPALLN